MRGTRVVVAVALVMASLFAVQAAEADPISDTLFPYDLTGTIADPAVAPSPALEPGVDGAFTVSPVDSVSPGAAAYVTGGEVTIHTQPGTLYYRQIASNGPWYPSDYRGTVVEGRGVRAVGRFVRSPEPDAGTVFVASYVWGIAVAGATEHIPVITSYALNRQGTVSGVDYYRGPTLGPDFRDGEVYFNIELSGCEGTDGVLIGGWTLHQPLVGAIYGTWTSQLGATEATMVVTHGVGYYGSVSGSGSFVRELASSCTPDAAGTLTLDVTRAVS